jgi:hypothetical protein
MSLLTRRASRIVAAGLAVSAGWLAQDQKPQVQQLSWMAGCWELRQGARLTQEQWLKPAGQSMLGMARTVAGDKTVFTEHLQIREQDGGLVLSVSIGIGNRATPFRAVRVAAKEIVFENPEHDFPQRIIYRQEAEGSLLGRIEGQEKGKSRAIDFPMKRSSCE